MIACNYFTYGFFTLLIIKRKFIYLQVLPTDNKRVSSDLPLIFVFSLLIKSSVAFSCNQNDAAAFFGLFSTFCLHLLIVFYEFFDAQFELDESLASGARRFTLQTTTSVGRHATRLRTHFHNQPFDGALDRRRSPIVRRQRHQKWPLASARYRSPPLPPPPPSPPPSSSPPFSLSHDAESSFCHRSPWRRLQPSACLRLLYCVATAIGSFLAMPIFVLLPGDVDFWLADA